jgi:HK97 family phage prohead protease
MTDPVLPREMALYREMPLVLIKREEPAAGAKPDENVLRFSASSETPVMRWGDTEILRHDEQSIRLDRLRTLGSALVNHDPNQRAARIDLVQVANKRLEVEVRFGSTEFAQQIRQEVADGLLRGISIGYRVNVWEIDEEKRTYTATDWEPFEVTFTPVPADASVGPGRSAEAWGQLVRSITPTAARAASQEARVSDPVIPNKPAAIEPAATIHKDEGARAAVIAEQREIAQQAKSLGLDAGDFVGLDRAAAKDAMLNKLAERTATPAPRQAAVATVDYDQADKARDAFTGALAHRAGVRSESLDKHKVANPMIGRSLIEVFRRYAKMVGLNTEDWSREDVAYYALGKRDMMSEMAQRSANVGTGQFTSFVFLNAITKIVAAASRWAARPPATSASSATRPCRTSSSSASAASRPATCRRPPS